MARLCPQRCRPAFALPPMLVLVVVALLVFISSRASAFLLPLPTPAALAAAPRPRAAAAAAGLRRATVAAAAADAAAAAAAAAGGSTDGGDGKKKEEGKGEKLVFKGLRSESFRHPLDQQATEQLRRLPGLEWIVRSIMRVAEEAVYLDNISSAVLVGPRQMPALHASLLEACRVLDLDVVPELYIRQNPVPNAYCMAIKGKRPFIVVHTCLLDLLTPEELQAVVAHEVGHIKCEHGVWITAANALALGLYSLGGGVGRMLGDRIQGLLLAWLRAAEFSCDRAALLVAQDLNVVSSALLKLVGGSQSQAQSGQLSVDEFLNQARAYDRAVATPVGRLLRNQLEPSLTHPLPVLRVRELDRWYHSNGYAAIASRGLPQQPAEAGAGAPAAAVAAASSASSSSSTTATTTAGA